LVFGGRPNSPDEHVTQYFLLGVGTGFVVSLIDSRVGQSLKIYSQEMFVTFLGKRAADPFYQGPLVLEAFKEGHDGLEFISRGWSGWVQTYVRDDWKNQPVGLGSCDGWEKESPLHIMGYHVGKTGQYIDKRRQILRRSIQMGMASLLLGSRGSPEETHLGSAVQLPRSLVTLRQCHP